LTFDILKSESAKLSDAQTDVLKRAKEGKFKHFILTGGNGTGKTVGAEIVKIKMAR
jgi:uncharacterized protein YgbK (DUF1537 family)